MKPHETSPVGRLPVRARGLFAVLPLLLCAPPAFAEPLCPDCYLDTTGRVRSVLADYEAQGAASDPAVLRTAIEEFLSVGIGTAYYWLYRDRNVADWDDPSTSARLSGEAWTYDNNALPVNFALHPLTGMGAYMLARSNQLSVPASYLSSFLASFAWEYVVEFREKVSINDQIVTPGAGLAIGEFFHKLGLYLDSAPDPNAARTLLQWSPLGLGVRGHRAIDGRDVPADTPRDSLGLSSDIWHAFEASYRVTDARSTMDPAYTLHAYAFDGRLVSLPGYLAPGHFSQFFYRADLATLRLGGEHSSLGNGFDLVADTVLLGTHFQNLEGTTRALEGTAGTIGVALGARYLRSQASGLEEQLGALHLPGFAFDWHARKPGLSAQALVRAHPDFVGAGASAYDAWEAAHPGEIAKSILRKQGYFFGWGGSARLEGRLRAGPAELRGALFYGRWASDEGRDRAPELITADVPAEAEDVRHQGALLLAPEKSPVSVGFVAEGRRYRSWVGRFSRTEAVTTRGLIVTGRF